MQIMALFSRIAKEFSQSEAQNSSCACSALISIIHWAPNVQAAPPSISGWIRPCTEQDVNASVGSAWVKWSTMMAVIPGEPEKSSHIEKYIAPWVHHRSERFKF